MRQDGLKTVCKPKFVHNTDSRQSLPIAENILARQFNLARPNTAFASDLTYIRSCTGWLYLAIVLDLYSRKILGWAMAPGMPAELVCAALRMAIEQRRPAAGLIVHSDRGSQYASLQHQTLLAQHGFICSMRRRQNCWALEHCSNAVAKCFFMTPKMKCVWQHTYASQAEAKIDVVSCIVGFYNSERLNSVLGNLSSAFVDGKWQQINLSLCPIILDQHKSQFSLVFTGFHWFAPIKCRSIW